MSEELIMLLIRLGVIVVPTGITCFIAGFLWGRGSAYREMQYDPDDHLDGPSLPPDVEPIRTTRLTSRNKTLEI